MQLVANLVHKWFEQSVDAPFGKIKKNHTSPARIKDGIGINFELFKLAFLLLN